MGSRRVYRQDHNSPRLRSFKAGIKETDLWLAVSSSCSLDDPPGRVEQIILTQRQKLEAYIATDPGFAASLEPYLVPADAPDIAREMTRAGNIAGVGPMAAVAGAFAQFLGTELLKYSQEVIVENGGDIFLKVSEPVLVGIFAGSSPLSGKIALSIDPGKTPLGICTSSGTLGPSFSRGNADAAVVIAVSTPLADAAATAIGNLVQSEEDLERALNVAHTIEGLSGALLICGEKFAAWGDISLKKVKQA